jgi:hypothetical protein
MSRNEVQALRPTFGMEATEHLLNKWEAIQKPRGQTEARIDTEDFNRIADDLGLKPYAPNKTEAGKKALGDLKYRVEKLIDQEQSVKKGALTREEKGELMRKEMARTVTVDGFFSDSTVPVIQLSARDAAKVVVPPAEKAQIAEALRVAYQRDPTNPRYAPTEENMRRLYLMKQSPAAGLIPDAK